MNEHFEQKACEQEEKTKIGFFKSHKKTLYSAAISVVLILCLVFASVYYFLPAYRYSKALDLIEAGEYNKAYDTLLSCGSFKDSEELLKNFKTVYKTQNVYEKFDGELSARTVKYEYDEKGRLLRTLSGDKQDVFNESKYEYDENGNVTLLASYNQNGLYMKHEYVYDQKGTKILEKTYDKDNVLSKKTEYDQNGKTKLYVEYFPDGRVKIENKCNREGHLISSVEYTYDGEIAKQSDYSETGKLLRSVSLEYHADGTRNTFVVEKSYNENGDMIRYTESNNDELLFGEEYEYTYDENKKPTLTVRYEIVNGKKALSKKTNATYDENGTLIRKRIFNGRGVLTGLYEYNAKGKQTLSISYDEYGKPSHRKQCEYTYDQDGKLLREYTDSTRDGTTETTYEYTENSQTVSTVRHTASGNLSSKSKTRYNAANVIVYSLHETFGSYLQYKTEIFRTENNEIKLYVHYDEESNPAFREVNFFDDFGTKRLSIYNGPESRGTCNITTHDVTRITHMTDPILIYSPPK